MLVSGPDGLCCCGAGRLGLSQGRVTIGDIAKSLPYCSLRHHLLLLAGILDQMTEIAAVGVFHEDIDDVLVVIEHALVHLYDVPVVERTEDADLVGGPSLLVLSHAETADLSKGGDTFLSACY